MKTRIREALSKRVKGNLYFHITAFEGLDSHVREQMNQAALPSWSWDRR
jgi:hypothetical protein